MAKLDVRSPPPNIDLHDLIEREAVLAPVVELRGAGSGMRRHLARLFERAAAVIPVPGKVWLHTSVAMPASLARHRAIFQASITSACPRP